MDNRVKLRVMLLMVVISLTDRNPAYCSSLNHEGLALLTFRERIERDPFGALSGWTGQGGYLDPCSWFGVGCSNGKVIRLNLRDFGLKGILGPEIAELAYLKYIVLRNNSFYGTIPKEIQELKKLEVLDLGYNNFSGSFPSGFNNKLSLNTLLLDNNEYLKIKQPGLYVTSRFQLDDHNVPDSATTASRTTISLTWVLAHRRYIGYRRQLQVMNPFSSNKRNRNNGLKSSPSPSRTHFSPSESPFSPLLPPSPSPLSFRSGPSPSISLIPSPEMRIPALVTPVDPQVLVAAPPPWRYMVTPPSPALSPGQIGGAEKWSSKHEMALVFGGVFGGSFLLLFAFIGVFFLRSHKVVTVRPWATGLSGQLQKAFVSGVPKLKRSELEAACEDFSNVIESLPDGTVYKGTLSSGVEIAVKSTAVKSRSDWTKNLEAQFRKKIDTLSKVNHKNFVNLIGYCEENEPFTRMMVFEYAPNGTLFEHLHVQEAERLDWKTRLRISMGMAYCLDHMHRLSPSIAHTNLQSPSIYLTEDYAAKISDFNLRNETTASSKTGSSPSSVMELLESAPPDPASNVYSYGVVLFEMITGRLPYSIHDGSLADWASACLRGERPLRDIVDPTLKPFEDTAVVEKLLEVIRDCVHRDPKARPTMKEVTVKMKEVTAMEPDGATPKLSPLWWAELEILSTEAS